MKEIPRLLIWYIIAGIIIYFAVYYISWFISVQMTGCGSTCIGCSDLYWDIQEPEARSLSNLAIILYIIISTITIIRGNCFKWRG